MINGAQYRSFVTNDLPLLLEMLDRRGEVIDEANNQYKSFIPEAMNALTSQNEIGDVNNTEHPGNEVLTSKRNRKQKNFDEYDTGNLSLDPSGQLTL